MPSNFLTLPDTANTLSVFYRPGEDVRLVSSSSPSIFTFGDFRIYTDNASDPLSAGTLGLSFGGFSTLESLDGVDLRPPTTYSVSPNELNLNPSDSFSYAYFGSFYTEVANAINTIINTFPYALLSYEFGTGVTIYDYTANYNNLTGEKTSTFKIPYSALKNQGGIIINSGSSIGSLSIASDYSQFSIQMSATTSAQTNTFLIQGFSFSADTSPYLEFSINGFLEGVTGATSTLPIYIRPTKERLANFKFAISELEYNMLYGFKLKTLDVENDREELENNFVWPKTIDGFNPDTYGDAFEEFKKSMLKAAADTDDAKTNILVKTVIPENYLELDSEQQIYASLVQTYGHEFDEIKRYIDGIAFAHTITYNKLENVPDKFIKKLSNLLGWKLSDSFNELDLFQYLAGNADGQNNSYSYYNLEIWRRILININWLYKKKGTRDAIQFIFKLLGAPECLLRFDEFVYKINQTFYQGTPLPTDLDLDIEGGDTADLFAVGLNRINENGYINYSTSEYIFQEGGTGRGNGDAYINQWRPEFDPLAEVDNIKLVVGDDEVFGSENIVNTKEVCIGLDPAQAIECDVFKFYQVSGTCWLWGSMAPPFSSLTVPFEYAADCDVIQPENITGMTFAQYIEHIYTNSINPQDRKVLGYTDTSFFYPTLRNAYLSYYLWSNPQSHRLTFHKLQPFLDLIEVNFNTYYKQLIPATTIFDCEGTIIRNTVFNRQKFVYKPGLNDGSEFRTRLDAYEPTLTIVDLTTKINDQIEPTINNINIEATIVETAESAISYPSVDMLVNINSITTGLEGYTIGGTIRTSGTIIAQQQVPPALISPPSRFFGFP